MTEPVLAAMPCPEPLLTRNARAALKLAASNGWTASAHIAIGYPPDSDTPVRSILLRASKEDVKLVMSWEGGADGSDMGWVKGFALRPKSWPQPLNWTECSALLKGERTQTKAQIKTEKEDAAAMLAAIDATGTDVVEVLPAGTIHNWCQGHVMEGPPRGRTPCSRPADSLGVLCEGPCRI